MFFATVIDDRGDGVFRTLMRGEFVPEMVPDWVKISPTAPERGGR